MLCLTIDLWVKYNTKINLGARLSLKSSPEVGGRLRPFVRYDGHGYTTS